MSMGIGDHWEWESKWEWEVGMRLGLGDLEVTFGRYLGGGDLCEDGWIEWTVAISVHFLLYLFFQLVWVG